jgi:alpha-amylase
MTEQSPTGAKAQRQRHRFRTALASGTIVAAVLALTAGAGGSAAAAPDPSAPTDSATNSSRGGSHNQRGDVIANLWEWNWASIAKECTTVLGPAGYGGVQVAPPQDSLSRAGTPGVPADPVHPWWEVYQPVDYNLTSRMGDEAQFKAMVSTCRKAGVKVYVDAVINHMTGQGNISYGGVSYSKYEYQGLYTTTDFHHTGPADCPTASGNIEDFNVYLQVTKCELVSLSDLRTEDDAVRDKLAAYLNKLLDYGVSGFRVDAAKHIPQADMMAIEARLHRTVDGKRPYIALEVSPGGPGKLSPFAYTKTGDLLGFDFAAQLRDAFKSYDADQIGSIADLQVFGEESGLLPSESSLAFVANHDSERNGSTLSYKDGATYVLATQFALAYGYGTPQVYASYTFTGGDDSPPSDEQGYITDTDCGAATWFCTNRMVVGMVGWHNYVGNAAAKNWYDDGLNLIAFSRGNKGWVVLNNGLTPQTQTIQTGLRRGTYCDVVHGAVSNGRCSGPTVTVASNGLATVTVGKQDAIAINLSGLVRQ